MNKNIGDNNDPFWKEMTTGSSGSADPHLRSMRTLEDGSSSSSSSSSSSGGGGHYTYLVDANGQPYEPYSIAWRYLGMYLDCDLDEMQQQENNDDENGSNNNGDDVFRRRRATTSTSDSDGTESNNRRELNSGDQNNDENDCSRKVLWAAYHDPHYVEGGEIGQYQFYDWRNDRWDDSTCTDTAGRNRCAKMDCHARRTKWQLIGVFQETDGLYDFAEQLIKHQGYCVWNDNENVWKIGAEQEEEEDGEDENEGDGHDNRHRHRRSRQLASGDEDGGDSTDMFEYMYSFQDKWAQGCTQMYLTDANGNALYRDVKPTAGGNITDGLYYDEDCTQKASMTFGAYIVQFYAKYYYDEDTGREVAESYQQGVAQWNELMTDFQVCQPCRAYSKTPTYEDDGGDDNHRRSLNENEGNNDGYDGEGYDEQSGFNCYDYAGYQNCDQCYKFESKTSMEVATAENLQRASDQGTILAVNAYGKTYGKGGIQWHQEDPARIAAVIWILVALSVVGAMAVFLVRRYKWSRIKSGVVKFGHRIQSRRFHQNLRKAFFDEDNDEDKLRKQLDQIVKEQHQEMEQMKLEMDQEYSIRNVEWERSHGTQEEFEDEPQDDYAARQSSVVSRETI